MTCACSGLGCDAGMDDAPSPLTLCSMHDGTECLSTQSRRISKTRKMAEVEDVTCLICAFPFETNERIRCVGVCGHDNVCSICFLRLRSIQRTFTCASCKQQLDHVICSKTVGAQFTDFTIWGDNIGPDYVFDEKSQMFFPKAYHQSKVEPLWAFNCKICSQTRRDMKQLRQHYQAEHHLHMCELCIDNKQSFPSEQKVYKQVEYENHLRKGDQDGSEGHPKCEFCRKRYYDKTGLFMHLSRDHFSCHLCDRAGILHKYYADYKHLEDHFRGGHHICEDPVCLAKRYVVFTNSIDLAAHSLSNHPFMQTRRTIPIHFKVRRPQNKEEEEDNDEEEGHQPVEGRAGGHFEGGMGGRARGGEWQVELPPSARDPRDAIRAQNQAAPEAASFVTVGRAFEDTLEAYPALAKVGGGALTIGGWGKLGNPEGQKQDFPALGPGPSGSRGVAGLGGGGNGGRSFSGVATGSFIENGKVGGISKSVAAADESWAISTKKSKRMKATGGISKPLATEWTKSTNEEDAESANLKSEYPVLSHAPKTMRKESGTGPPVAPVRTQPQYSSLAVLARDDSVSYKIAGNNRNQAAAVEYDAAVDEEDDDEAAAMAIALSQINQLEVGVKTSDEEVPNKYEVKETNIKDTKDVKDMREKKEKKVIKKSVAASAVDGWGSAFKAVGIGAPIKKQVTGLSLAKPIKKAVSSANVGKFVDVNVKESGVPSSRSFDDLKQIGRRQRDMDEQYSMESNQVVKEDVPKKGREYSQSDYPALGIGKSAGIGNGGGAGGGSSAVYNNLNYSGKSDNSSISAASLPPPPGIGLSVEQRNENIRAFVAEAKLKKALSSGQLARDTENSSSSFAGESTGGFDYGSHDSFPYHFSDSNGYGNGNGNSNGSVSGGGAGHSNGSSNTGGNAVPPPPPAEKLSSFDYHTPEAPIDFSDLEYPSLGPGPGMGSNTWGQKENKKMNYSAAGLSAGKFSKTPEDLLAAKKEKAAKKITTSMQELSLDKK